MESDADFCGLDKSRPRTLSNQSSKYNFPLTTCDSGLYTGSSNNSDCSLALESDIESDCKLVSVKDDRLKMALQDARKMRSELERLTKSEQWYKQELRHQKSIRLEDLEKIYTQERKFMQENQRLQKECVRLYDKCTDLEKEVEQKRQEATEQHVYNHSDEELEEDLGEFEKEQQLALIKDQQQLIMVLRKQKRSLLEDLRNLTEEKDEKVMELQRLLADLEFDNKRITKKCTQYAKERLNVENNLKQSDQKLSITLAEKLNLQKTLVDLKQQLEIQKQLVKLKENEIENIQQHYTDKIQQEHNLDEVHSLSIKYQEEINSKTLEIIELKSRLNEMQDELEDLQNLQQQNELQQRQIEQLNFSMETLQLEIQELKYSEMEKNKQLEDFQKSITDIFKDKDILNKTINEQHQDLLKVQQELKSTLEQYMNVQELYKKTQFQVELLEMEQGKLKFQSQRDQQDIELLRHKLKEYLQQTAELSNKIKDLEAKLGNTLKENSQLKLDYHILKQEIKGLQENPQELNKDNNEKRRKAGGELESIQKETSNNLRENKGNPEEQDIDLLQLTQQSSKLLENLELLKVSHSNDGRHPMLKVLQDFLNKMETTPMKEELTTKSVQMEEAAVENDTDFLQLTQQSNKFLENLYNLQDFLREKDILLSSLNSVQQSKEGMEKLVIENEILKKKICEIETEAVILQLKQDINEKTQKCTNLEENLEKQLEKIENLKENLLKNDSRLYKMERKFKLIQEDNSNNLEKLQKENAELKEELLKEQGIKTDLNKRISQETEKVKELKQNLEEIKIKQKPIIHMAIQCDLEDEEKLHHTTQEVDELKKHILQLQEQQRNLLENDNQKREERLQLLHKLMDLQNTKIQNTQQHQQDWEDMLRSLTNAQSMEEQMRQELKLKRMELEELNKVFEEQNEELRKLEEFTALLEYKRQQEKDNLRITFQTEINVMRQHMKEYEQEIDRQKEINQELEKRNDRIYEDYNEDYSTEVADYKKEIRVLKSKVSKTLEEKEQLMQQLNEMEGYSNNDHKRDAIYIPELQIAKLTVNPLESSVEDVSLLKQNISEDHLRILTKVLEAEYQRKMQRYDEHIHSLLTNVSFLKKSLKANEEKTALLSEEQLQTKEELKDLQKTKRNLEEIRLKYEQSQTTIKELKQALAFERKKFELSDIGKSSQNNGTTYEVTNLIDDYKKLIQQSALATKRPTTSAILDLITRSNQCVPNLQKLETNVCDLRSELQNFLTAYTQKMPVTSLITAASLSVPPSLMDELRVASSDGF